MCSYESLNIQKLNLLSQKAFQAFMTWTKDHDLGLNHNGHIPDREKGGPKHCLGVTPYLREMFNKLAKLKDAIAISNLKLSTD